MECIIGAVLAGCVLLSAMLIGFDRQRAFYPTVMIVIASYCGLFAVLGGSQLALTLEGSALSVFVLVAIFGFRTNLWWVVAALVAHGVFDLVHARLIEDPGVPLWWPGFCLTFGVVAGAYLTGLLRARRLPPHPTPETAARE